MCEDYRAGATIDGEHDANDRGRRIIAGPARALSAGNGRCRASTRTLWNCGGPYAPQITGYGLEGISHFMVEEAPLDVADKVTTFLTAERLR